MAKIQDRSSEFNKEICEYKHTEIDNKLDDIKSQIQDSVHSMKEDIIEALKIREEKMSSDFTHKEEGLKNKIIVTEKGILEKVDTLADFQATLRGNGTPSIFELVRTIKFRQNMVLAALMVIFFLMIVGDYRGISIEKIRRFIGLESKQVDTQNKPPSTSPSASPIVPSPISDASIDTH
jgi:hypothetical protein